MVGFLSSFLIFFISIVQFMNLTVIGQRISDIILIFAPGMPIPEFPTTYELMDKIALRV